jgi:hypothetical protein
MDGCNGGSVAGADFLRDVTQIVATVIASTRTIATFTMRRPAFGFPAIMARYDADDRYEVSAQKSHFFVKSERSKQKRPESRLPMLPGLRGDNTKPRVRQPSSNFLHSQNHVSPPTHPNRYGSERPLPCGVPAGGSEMYPIVLQFQQRCY